MTRFLAVLTVAASWLLGAARPGEAAAAPAPPKAIVVSWDGAPDWVVDRLLAEGQLPAVRGLAERGMAAAWSRPPFPSKTAVGHAALWTGAWPETNGITGNDVPLLPRAEHSLVERQSGFSSLALTAEPLSITAARAGRKVVSLSTTQSYPPGPWLETLRQRGVAADRWTALSGFENEIAPAAVLDAQAFGPLGKGWTRLPPSRQRREATMQVGDETLYLLLYDDRRDPTRGFDSVLARLGSRDAGAARGEVTVKPRTAGEQPAGWSAPLGVRRGQRTGNTFLRLFELAPDGSRLALYRRRVHAIDGAIAPADLVAYGAAYPGFHDTGFVPYGRGELGLPIPAGGDGEAERRLLEIVAFDSDLLIGGSTFVLTTWRPDLLFLYSPAVDDAGHAWMGLLDPQTPGHDPALAARVWPWYARAFAELDRWLAALVAAAPPETIVALVSDHGMSGVRRHVVINRILEEAGLLAWDGVGRIDLAKTEALAPFTDFVVRVNGTENKDGIVPPERREEVLRRATAALLGARDPATGGAMVRLVVRPEEVPSYGVGGPRAGELLYDLAPGYYPYAGYAASIVEASRRSWGSGEHGYWPERRDVQAIFYAAGPGIRAGARPGEVRIIDIAPTLAHLLGLPAPAQATGRVVCEALER